MGNHAARDHSLKDKARSFYLLDPGSIPGGRIIKRKAHVERFNIELTLNGTKSRIVMVGIDEKDAKQRVKEWFENEGKRVRFLSTERIIDETGTNWLECNGYNA